MTSLFIVVFLSRHWCIIYLCFSGEERAGIAEGGNEEGEKKKKKTTRFFFTTRKKDTKKTSLFFPLLCVLPLMFLLSYLPPPLRGQICVKESKMLFNTPSLLVFPFYSRKEKKKKKKKEKKKEKRKKKKKLKK